MLVRQCKGSPLLNILRLRQQELFSPTVICEHSPNSNTIWCPTGLPAVIYDYRGDSTHNPVEYGALPPALIKCCFKSAFL
jgi:hypothetical protein